MHKAGTRSLFILLPFCCCFFFFFFFFLFSFRVGSGALRLPWCKYRPTAEKGLPAMMGWGEERRDCEEGGRRRHEMKWNEMKIKKTKKKSYFFFFYCFLYAYLWLNGWMMNIILALEVETARNGDTSLLCLRPRRFHAWRVLLQTTHWLEVQ